MEKIQFNWVLGGIWHNRQNSIRVRCHLARNNDLDRQLIKFWEIEEISAKFMQEKNYREIHFSENMQQTRKNMQDVT